MSTIASQRTHGYDGPAQDLADAIQGLDDESRASLIGIIERNLASLPTVGDRWRVAREVSGSPSSEIECAYGSQYEALLSEIGLTRNRTADGLRHDGFITKDPTSLRLLGIVQRIEGLGREHIQLALQKLQ